MTFFQERCDSLISESRAKEIIEEGPPAHLYEKKRVLVLTPDGSRTCPLPMMVRAVRDTLGRKTTKLDFMVAVGTHPVLSERQVLELYKITDKERARTFVKSDFFCHRWDLPDTFLRIGELSREDTGRISSGLLQETVPIAVNRKIYDYDMILVMGPVFPHEVVGFSGGAKYLFPGISGGELLHFFHWMGAVMTCREIIGKKDTPVRQVINLAMEKIDLPIHCLAMVVRPGGDLCGLFAGDIREAWSAAADLSSQVHIVIKKKPYRIVLGRAPEMYDEIWTGGKVMYKLEQVVADNGKLIIYAPHINRISSTWGDYIDKIGYHVRDYFLTRMEQFKDIPKGVLAHSTHVCGTGSFENGIEKPRIEVVLATSIPKEKCAQINLGYMDPAEINIADYQRKEEEGILYVDHAGEILYRLDH